MTELSRSATIFSDPPSAKPAAWMAPIRALWPILLCLAISTVLFAFILPRIDAYQQDRIANCGVYIILAVSLTVVNGFTGQFSIGHSGFMAVGGYAAASLMYYGTYRWFGNTDFHGGLLSWTGARADAPAHLIGRGDWLFLASLLFGAVIAAAIGWLVGLPSLRLRGDYLAIVTLGFCEIVRVILQSSPDQLSMRPADPEDVDTTARYLGDPFVAAFPQLLHARLPRPVGYLWQQVWSRVEVLTHVGGALGFSGAPTYSSIFWIALAAMITVALTIRLKYSSYGRAMLSIREDDIAAQAVGVNVTKLKVRAFIFSAFFAGIAGGLFVSRNGNINAGELGFQKSFDFVIMVVIGGLGSISGAAIAAVLLTLLPEWLRDPPSLWPWGWIVAGIIAIWILVFSPRRRAPLLWLLTICIAWESVRLVSKHFGFDLSQYRLVIYSLLLIVTMIARPEGLFGVQELWDQRPRAWQW